MAILNAWKRKTDRTAAVLAGDGNAAGPRTAPEGYESPLEARDDGKKTAEGVLCGLVGVQRSARALPATMRERYPGLLLNGLLISILSGALLGCGEASTPTLSLPLVVAPSAQAEGDVHPPTSAGTSSPILAVTNSSTLAVRNSPQPTDADSAREGADDLGDITSLDSPQFPTNALNGDGDAVDYYSFTLTEAKKVGLALRQLDANADIFLEDAEGTVLHSSAAQGTSKEWISATLPAGTYYVRVEAQEAGDNQYVFRYGVSDPDPIQPSELPTTTETVLAPPTDADAAREGADDLGDITSLDSPQFPTNSLDGDGDAVDYYSFTLTEAKKVGLALRQLDANADIFLEDAEGTVLHSSAAQGTSKEWISATLPAGTYYVRVEAQEAGDNQYVFRYGVSDPDLADLTDPPPTTETEQTTTETELDETYATLESVRQEYTASDSFLMRMAFSRRFVSTIDAYLTAGQAGNHVLRIPDITPFSGTYPLANKVSGWDAQDNEITWPSLVMENHESDFGNDHDVALAYSKSYANGSDLSYAGYGWWAISPVRGDVTFRPRLVAAFAGLSHGIDTRTDDMPGSTDTPMTATWHGRATGHVLGKGARWVLSGDVELTATLQGADGGEVQGEIGNTRIVEVGAHTLRVGGRTAGDWHTITLSSAQVQGNTYSGTAAIKDPIVRDPVTSENIIPDGFVGPLMRAPIVGHYEGAFYGPDAVETAGRGYLLRDIGAVATTDNSVVFGFGARQ